MNPKQLLTIIRDTYNLNKKGNTYENGNISYANWWKNNLEIQWFTEFIDRTISQKDKKIRFYSVFGSYKDLQDGYKGTRIFYTGENLASRVRHSNMAERSEKTYSLDRRAAQYREHICNYGMDLILTFCPDGMDNAIRFPYWLLTHFANCYSIDDVQQRLDEIEKKYQEVDSSRRGAVVVASHDFYGTRANICDSIGDTVDITYGGKWRNNTDALWNKYGNDKGKFLHNFRFNICPENMDAKEYVTEKIWDSLENGCIPVYSGALGNPEPRIFNTEAFILWSYDNENDHNIEKIKRLSNDNDYYKNLKTKQLFVEGSSKYIWEMISEFIDRINSI
ncbi:glycosyltransferase family 10 domain-containing protein [Butyrivibrio fibrisolvens]|uniref:glycosyltransferase family 10 domain-containing protein n=1 Tax=Butyrivibrio fibrisolvens TaxID=831 RepID=UPI0004276677|nr:glycosyltransferase family 10 [Butyrivibrio fibrisolvens]